MFQFTPEQIIVSGVGLSALCLCFGIRPFLAVFFSFGMYMIFQAWLVHLDINHVRIPGPNGYLEYYTASYDETIRIKEIHRSYRGSFSEEEFDNWHNCLYHNVCKGRYAR
jgi:hypothetical protein